jgi:hypothetical protein
MSILDIRLRPRLQCGPSECGYVINGDGFSGLGPDYDEEALKPVSKAKSFIMTGYVRRTLVTARC